MKLSFAASFLSMPFLAKGHTPSELSDGQLKQPIIKDLKDFEDGTIPLSFEAAEHETVATSKFKTRLFDGLLPGPTIRVRSGETLKIFFENNLEEQEDVNDTPDGFSDDNDYGLPDYTNLHYHGGHVSGELPSDDVTMKIPPGGSYSYLTDIPENHFPGTHWVHPHVHHSSLLHVGGGAALALIVEDDPVNFPIPPEVVTAEDILLFVQDFKVGPNSAIENAKTQSRDKLLDIQPVEDVGDDFHLVNGQFMPDLKIVAGEWQRLRVVYAGWDRDALDFEIHSSSDDDNNDKNACETYLLAKDGIYISDYPRKLDLYPIPTGGRADIMLRCNDFGTFSVTYSDSGIHLLTITSELPDGQDEVLIADGPTDNFEFQYPDYLRDLQETNPDPGCSCETRMGGRTVNDRQFNGDEYVHKVAFGSVVERELAGVTAHPYHQHVYPFQLITGYEDMSTRQFEDTEIDVEEYFKNGDWHDTVYSKVVPGGSNPTMRYVANKYDGKVMVHCHRLYHEDEGMMSQELIELDGGECACDFPDIPTV